MYEKNYASGSSKGIVIYEITYVVNVVAKTRLDSASWTTKSRIHAITTDASLVAAQDSDNIIKTQSTSMSNDPLSQEISSCDSPRRQETIGVLLLRLGLTAATVAAAHCGLFACNVVRLMLQPGVKYYEVLVRTNEHVLLGFFRDCDVPTVSQRIEMNASLIEMNAAETRIPFVALPAMVVIVEPKPERLMSEWLVPNIGLVDGIPFKVTKGALF
ncbi:hypothetical protein Tco_0904912 [Tanacetum coccineum]